jgi:hypothetical protein
MANADMFVIWLNSQRYPMLSRRSPRGHSMPVYNPDLGGARLVALQTQFARPQWAQLAITVQLPLTTKNYPSLTFIYASSNSRVSTPDSLASGFPDHHGSKGRTTTIDFPAVALPNNQPLSLTQRPPAPPAFTQRALNVNGQVVASGNTPSNLPSAGRSSGAATGVIHSFCEKGQTFCFYGKPEASGSHIVFTIHSAAEGWAGFGIGNSMLNADMYVGWQNSTRGYTVSRRNPAGYHTPTYNSVDTKGLLVVPLAVPAPAWSKLSFSVRRTLDDSIKTGNTYIYAYGVKKATEIDSPVSHFSRHNAYGKIDGLDFMSQTASQPIVEQSSSGQKDPMIASDKDTYRMIIQLHGIFMFVAWLIAPFIGIFIARYLKDALGVYWYRLHLGIMFGGTGVLSLLAFILVVLYGGSPHFDDLHVSGIAGKVHGVGYFYTCSNLSPIAHSLIRNSVLASLLQQSFKLPSDSFPMPCGIQTEKPSQSLTRFTGGPDASSFY